MDYFFINAISEICQHSLLVNERPLRCMIVLNPVAGGFSDKPRWKSNIDILQQYQQKAQTNPKRDLYKNVIMNLTDGKGSAGEMTKTFLERAEKDPVPLYMIISAGGSGTHKEVMSTLFKVSAPVRKNVAVLRLPMGTDNDGADSPTLEGALDLLLNPVHIEYVNAIQLIPSQNGPLSWKKSNLYAFNIMSVGLDAYVTHITNVMKKNVPGDAYKFWTDIAALSSEKKVNADNFAGKAFDDKNNEVISFKEKLLLLSMGITGSQTYSSQQYIFPDDRNVCGVKQIPNEASLKDPASKGKYDDKDIMLFKAHHIKFKSNQPMLAQMDGETISLQPDDFPALITLTPPTIPLLKPDNN